MEIVQNNKNVWNLNLSMVSVEKTNDAIIQRGVSSNDFNDFLCIEHYTSFPDLTLESIDHGHADQQFLLGALKTHKNTY